MSDKEQQFRDDMAALFGGLRAVAEMPEPAIELSREDARSVLMAAEIGLRHMQAKHRAPADSPVARAIAALRQALE